MDPSLPITPTLAGVVQILGVSLGDILIYAFAVAGILCVIFAFAAGPWSFGQQAISVRAAEVGFWLASALAYAYFGFCRSSWAFSIHFEA